MSRRPVILDPHVYDELDDAYLWWAKHRSAEQASRWYRDIERAILGLAENAERHGLAAENDRFPVDVRQLLFGLGRRPTHRVLFTIRPECVYVISVRHVAQDAVTPDEL